jgi:hypothetical protein
MVLFTAPALYEEYLLRHRVYVLYLETQTYTLFHYDNTRILFNVDSELLQLKIKRLALVVEG